MDIVLFFHGFGSSDNTNKFTCIEMNKVCINVDYANDGIMNVVNRYDKLVNDLMKSHDNVILAGHSLGGFFANLFSHRYNLPALLINPCMSTSYLKDRIPNIDSLGLTFPTDGNRSVSVLVEMDDEVLNFKKDIIMIENNPIFSITKFNGGHHRTCRADSINLELDLLGGHPFGFI